MADDSLLGLAGLGACEARRALEAGSISSAELVAACLARIRDDEERVQAWAWLNPEYALQQARAADAVRAAGGPLGALHGIPVGVKDIIDTCDMPTEHGTVLHAGRRPQRDAAVVARLRAAGAIILGKTVTTEMATYAPGKTRNPVQPGHTPGGSSSGSAAAVAAYMAPLALGTQTNGSVIRPAAYCGVFGFKPTHGLISRRGILTQSPPLDQVGVMARSIEDLALCADALAGCDGDDEATRPGAAPQLSHTARQEPPLPPRLAFVKTPIWEQVEVTTRDAFAELVDCLGDCVEEVELAPGFAAAWEWHKTIMEADLAYHFRQEYARGRERLSDPLRGQIERGGAVSAVAYHAALDGAASLRLALEQVFYGYDAIVTPATAGPAPAGLASTGSPAFCTLWTLCGVPALTMPLLQSPERLPIGVQLVGRYGDDGRLLRSARWLLGRLRAA